MASQLPAFLLGTSPNFQGVGQLLSTDRLSGVVNEGDFANNSVIGKTGGTVQSLVVAAGTMLGNDGTGLAPMTVAQIQAFLSIPVASGDPNPPTVPLVDAQALTSTIDYLWTPQRVGQALTANALLLVNYDPGLTGRVDFANNVSDGVNVTSATDVYNHIQDVSIHSPLNDTITTVNNLWSADKIATEISTTFATPPASLITYDNTLTGLVALNVQDAIDEIYLEKGAPNGIATLDGTGKIPVAQIPAIGLPEVFIVLDTAARLALTVQEGDEAIETSTGDHYIYDGTTWFLRTTAPPVVLNSMTDVTITAAAAGELLIYNATTSQWVDAALTAGVGIGVALADGSVTVNLDIDSLTLEATIDQTNDTIAMYDDSAGAIRKVAVGSIAASLASLSDTNIVAPAAGQLLIYDATASQWDNAALTAGVGIAVVNADASITVSMDIPSLTNETTVDAANDTLVMYDASAGAHREVTITNALASVDTLAELNDTAIVAPAAGQLLIYDATSGDWDNVALTAGTAIIATTGDGTLQIDFDIPSLAAPAAVALSDSVALYDTSAAAHTEATLTSINQVFTFANLDDTVMTTPVVGHTLYHDGTDWVNLTAGTVGQVFQANGAAAPSWVTPVAPVLRPFSAYPANASNTYFGLHTGAGANSKNEVGMGVIASLPVDSKWQLRFELPRVLPAGTAKLRLLALANATTGNAKVNPGWASVAAGDDPSSATMNSEGTSTLSWGAGDADKYKELLITLDADTLVAGEIVVMDLVFESTSWTLAVGSVWQASVIWE